MNEADLLAAYEKRAAALASYAAARGVELTKSEDAHELTVSGVSGSVVFPIVTDARDWKIMTPEAAFYGAMLDAKSWKNVKIDDATTAGLETDEAERTELPLIKREASAEADRMEALAAMLGGEANLDALLANVDAG